MYLLQCAKTLCYYSLPVQNNNFRIAFLQKVSLVATFVISYHGMLILGVKDIHATFLYLLTSKQTF